VTGGPSAGGVIGPPPLYGAGGPEEGTDVGGGGGGGGAGAASPGGDPGPLDGCPVGATASLDGATGNGVPLDDGAPFAEASGNGPALPDEAPFESPPEDDPVGEPPSPSAATAPPHDAAPRAKSTISNATERARGCRRVPGRAAVTVCFTPSRQVWPRSSESVDPYPRPLHGQFRGIADLREKSGPERPKKLVGARSGQVNRAQTVPALGAENAAGRGRFLHVSGAPRAHRPTL
jgi:hypothetical protein